MNFQNAEESQEELGSELFSAVGNEIGRRTEVEHPMDNECASHGARGYVLQLNSFHQLGESIYDVKEVSVSAWSAD